MFGGNTIRLIMGSFPVRIYLRPLRHCESNGGSGFMARSTLKAAYGGRSSGLWQNLIAE
jgi:hypothetical protein